MRKVWLYRGYMSVGVYRTRCDGYLKTFCAYWLEKITGFKLEPGEWRQVTITIKEVKPARRQHAKQDAKHRPKRKGTAGGRVKESAER